MKKRGRLIWRLFLTYLLITLGSLVIVSWYATSSLGRFYIDQTALDLEARAHLLETQVKQMIVTDNTGAIDTFCKDAGRRSFTRITVILPSGEVIGDSREEPKHMDNHANRPEVAVARTGEVGSSIRTSSTLQQRMMYVAIPIYVENKIAAVVRTSLPVTALDEALADIRIKIAIGGFLTAVLAAIFSLIMSHQYSRPIEVMKVGAERFAAGDFEHRLNLPASQELAGLADAMNQMAAQLSDRIDTIENQRRELETVLSSMLEGLVAIDNEGQIISMNQAAAKWFQIETKDAQGHSVQEVIRNQALQKFVTDAIDSLNPVENDIIVFQNGERVLNVKSTPLLDSGYDRIGTLIVFNDVTQLRRLENMRRDFVANVSHEIKTPLTAIKGFVETLHQGSVESQEEKTRFLGIVGKHVDRLNSIIEDLLSLARIEKDDEDRSIQFKKQKLSDVFNSALQICRPQAQQKDIRINLECDNSIEAHVDHVLLEQAIVNLLDNAVKYSEAGSEINIMVMSEGEDIRIRIKDQGIGIAKKHINRLFERFYRVDKARSRTLGGTGLGLAIVKHIAQAHGGRVTVESKLGEGSTFTIQIPRNRT